MVVNSYEHPSTVYTEMAGLNDLYEAGRRETCPANE